MKCDNCDQVTDYQTCLNIEEDMAKRISSSSDSESLIDLMQSGKDETTIKIHETNFLRVRLLMKVLDIAVKTLDEKLLKVASKHGDDLVNILRKLESGNGKLTMKYSHIKAVIETFCKDALSEKTN